MPVTPRSRRRRKSAPSTALCRLWRGAPCGGHRQGFETSRGGPGSTGSSLREAFVPLHPPGHARVDFGEAAVELRRATRQGRILLPDPAPFRCPVGEGRLPADDGGLSGRPCQRLRGPTLDRPRQHDPGGGAESGDRHAPVHSPTCNRIICSATASTGPAGSRPW